MSRRNARRSCKHERTRGIYGDEILSTMRRALWPTRWGGGEVARVRCLDCGRPLYGRALGDADGGEGRG